LKAHKIAQRFIEILDPHQRCLNSFFCGACQELSNTT
jgi:hypothetical protein